MLILPGAPAHSDFRLEKLLETLRRIAPVSAVYAEYVHFVDVDAALTDAEQQVLDGLLHYGPRLRRVAAVGQLLLVAPRIGTVSPWSSKATDIAHHCELASIRRIERGIAYYLQFDSEPDTEQRRAVANALHDRMVECVLQDADQAVALCEVHEPRPLVHIELLEKIGSEDTCLMSRNTWVYFIEQDRKALEKTQLQ